MTGPGPLVSICFQAGEIPPSIPLPLLGIVTVQSTSSAGVGQLLWPLLASFVCGSIPFAWLIGKSRGIDLLKAGSGNPGATNLSREVGKPYGLLGLSLDVMKGAFPILWFSSFSPGSLMLIGAASVVGHCFSPFLRGRGGKGVATTGGGVAGSRTSDCTGDVVELVRDLQGDQERRDGVGDGVLDRCTAGTVPVVGLGTARFRSRNG